MTAAKPRPLIRASSIEAVILLPAMAQPAIADNTSGRVCTYRRIPAATYASAGGVRRDRDLRPPTCVATRARTHRLAWRKGQTQRRNAVAERHSGFKPRREPAALTVCTYQRRPHDRRAPGRTHAQLRNA